MLSPSLKGARPGATQGRPRTENAPADSASEDDVTTLGAMAPEGPTARANPARGLALIATAVILGIFVLRQGFETGPGGMDAMLEEARSEDEASGSTDDADDGDDSEAGSDDSASVDEEPEEPAEPRAPAEVGVRVANTTSIGGSAGELTAQVEGTGYQTVEATDAAERDRGTTLIVFREGFEQEALALTAAIAPEGVQVEAEPVPEDPPLSQGNEPLMSDDVDLLVLLGHDLAEQLAG